LSLELSERQRKEQKMDRKENVHTEGIRKKGKGNKKAKEEEEMK
jgi:hypothetical protein